MKCPLCGSPQKKEKFVKEKIEELKVFNEKTKLIKKATDISVSHHAIDRMSTRHVDVYLKYREGEDHGLVTWMRSVGLEMLKSGQLSALQEQVKCYGIRWLFQKSKKSLTYKLTTVAPINKNKIKHSDKIKKRKIKLWKI